MRFLRTSFCLIAVQACGILALHAAEFSKVEGAIAVFQDESIEDWKLRDEAEQYLLKHPKEALPPLMRIVTNQEEGWVYSAYALTKFENPEVAPFFIQKLKDNFFLKEADGRRKEFGFGSKNGCEIESNLFGSVLASLLGSLGDKRAIPVLREAVAKGDGAVQKSSYAALHQLGAITLDELFTLAKRSTDPAMGLHDTILGIIQETQDSALAIALYDRVIAESPADSYAVASAHYWKIGRYRQLRKYDQALAQCILVQKIDKFPNLAEQIPRMQKEIRQQAAKEGTTLRE